MNPYPKHRPMWQCSCGTWNDPGRATCINAANHAKGPKPRGPLAPPRPDEPGRER